MITPAQHQANRQNAQKSTGPRTEEGKQRSSQNALRHGLTVTDESLILKNSEELSLLIAAHSETYAPRNEAEHTLVRLLATIRLRRVEMAEEQLWEEERPNLDRIGKFDRYRSSAERAFHRNYNALEKLRKERNKTNPTPQAKQPEPIQQPATERTRLRSRSGGLSPPAAFSGSTRCRPWRTFAPQFLPEGRKPLTTVILHPQHQ